MKDLITAVEIGQILWPDKPVPEDHAARRDYTGGVRKWLQRRGVARIDDMCGPRGEALYRTSDITEALEKPRGKGKRINNDPESRAEAASKSASTTPASAPASLRREAVLAYVASRPDGATLRDIVAHVRPLADCTAERQRLIIRNMVVAGLLCYGGDGGDVVNGKPRLDTRIYAAAARISA